MTALFNKNIMLQWLPIVVAAIAVIFAWWMSLAPTPLPISAPPDLFSAERAHQHIAATSMEPKPAGSIGNDHACQYIKEELDRIGVENEVVLRYDKTSDRQVSRRRAVLGRIRGTANTRAFAVDAHFDSVAWAPGAADDFSGIAAMLEAARALKASPPLKNDVIFVFSDQEEFNMGGAKLFRNHPWFLEVGVMLGLETRGNSGPALMFETSPHNGFVIRALARSGAGARTNSIMYDFYKRMPFNSDFDHYKDLAAGLNVAFINHFDRYHTMLDNPANVSLASLQHHGNYIVGLARYLGDMHLDNCYAPDAAYFNTLGNHMVVFPLSWGMPLCILGLAVLAATLAVGFLSGRLSWSGVLAGAGLVLLAATISALPIGAISYVLYLRFKEAALYQNNVFALGFHLLGFAVLLSLLALWRRWTRPQELLAGGLVLWAVGLALFQYAAPGGAHLALIPLLFGCLYLGALLACAQDDVPSDRALAWSVALALPPLMFIAPLQFMACYAATVLASFLIVPMSLVLAAFLLPQLHLISSRNALKTACAVGAVGALLLLTAYAGSLPSPKSPQLNSLAYGMDFDQGEACWLSSGPALDEWTSRYIPEGSPQVAVPNLLPRDKHAYFKAPAPLPPFGPPVLEVLNDRIENGRRILECRLDSPRDAQRMSLTATSEIEVYGASVLGHELAGSNKEWYASFEILPREGVELRLEVEPNRPLRIHIREVSFSLPEFPDFVPRPAHMMPEPNRRLNRGRSMESEYVYSVCTLDLGSGPRG